MPPPPPPTAVPSPKLFSGCAPGPPRNVFQYKSHPPLPSCGKTVLQPLGTLTARTAGERARDIGSDCKSRAASRAGAQTPTRGRSGVRGEHPRSERAPSRPDRVHPVSKSVHPSLERALRVFPRPLKLKLSVGSPSNPTRSLKNGPWSRLGVS